VLFPVQPGLSLFYQSASPRSYLFNHLDEVNAWFAVGKVKGIVSPGWQSVLLILLPCIPKMFTVMFEDSPDSSSSSVNSPVVGLGYTLKNFSGPDNLLHLQPAARFFFSSCNGSDPPQMSVAENPGTKSGTTFSMDIGNKVYFIPCNHMNNTPVFNQQ